MWVGSACVRAFDSCEASTILKITNLARPGLGCAHHPILSPYWGALSLAIGSNSCHHSFGNMFTVAFSFLIFPVKAPGPNNHRKKYEVNFWGGLQDEWRQDSPRLQTTPFLQGWGDSLGQQQANLGVNWERRLWWAKKLAITPKAHKFTSSFEVPFCHDFVSSLVALFGWLLPLSLYQFLLQRGPPTSWCKAP